MYNVKSLFAFGSVCTDKFNDNSDIDLLIAFNAMDFGDYADAYFDIAEELENIFKRPVDLITDKSLSNRRTALKPALDKADAADFRSLNISRALRDYAK